MPVPPRTRCLSRCRLLVGGRGLLAAGCTPATLTSPANRPPSSELLPVALATPSRNRVVLALIDAENRSVPKARAIARFSNMRSATTAEVKAEASVRYAVIGPGDHGIDVTRVKFDKAPARQTAARRRSRSSYVTRVEFDAAGRWGLAVIAALPRGQEAMVSPIAFSVSERSKTPTVGARPPASRQTTLAAKPIENLRTAKPRDPWHDRTVVDALAVGTPMLIWLGSSSFCASATGGPNREHLVAAHGISVTACSGSTSKSLRTLGRRRLPWSSRRGICRASRGSSL